MSINNVKQLLVLTVYVQGLFVAPDVHKDCNTIHTMYHNTNTAILHKIAVNMMQNKVNKVTILHNNNNNSKHL